jgi:hypothetical protein
MERTKNIKKWFSAMTCGTLSLFTCCMCCGCCGFLKSPVDLVNEIDEVMSTDGTKLELNPAEVQLVNTTNWCGIGSLALCLPTCGCCCGCCGVFSPAETCAVIGQT